MDNAKDILAVLWKSRFWIASVLVVLVALGAWYSASAKLTSEMTEHVSQIETEYKKAEGILSKGIEKRGEYYHPNDRTYQETNRLISELKIKVRTAWQQQYERQKDLFVWPEELGERFRQAVQDLRPIEKKVPYPTPLDKEVGVNLREIYGNYIKRELPKLAEIIGARWFEDQKEDRGTTSGPVVAESAPVVFWNPENQQSLLKRITVFPSEANTPTTLQMLYAQEDLWVLRSLLQIVKSTNGDAEAYWQAAIKQINSIKIGSNVHLPKGHLLRLGGTASGSRSSATATATVGSSGDPAEGRYVDRHFRPLSAAQLRGSYTSTDPEQAYLSVAKRMPVQLNLVMDQRMINRLLAECANAPLTVEVRQVRINPGSSSGTSSGTASSPFSKGGAFARSGRSSGSEDVPFGPYDLPVEIYGVIYIYNPVPDDTLVVQTAQEAAGDQAAQPNNET